MRRTFSALTLSVVAALLLAVPAAATPLQTGCPSGTVALTVDQWAAMGYSAPSDIDAAGNQDGIVCGLAMPAGFTVGFEMSTGITPQHAILYLFSDDNNPALR